MTKQIDSVRYAPGDISDRLDVVGFNNQSVALLRLTEKGEGCKIKSIISSMDNVT